MAEKKTPFSQVVIQLSPDHLSVVEEADTKVGARVRLIVYGSLKGLSKEATDASEEGGANVGTLEISASSVKFASNSDIAELFDEELDA